MRRAKVGQNKEGPGFCRAPHRAADIAVRIDKINPEHKHLSDTTVALAFASAKLESTNHSASE
jgi:hypothetical protein